MTMTREWTPEAVRHVADNVRGAGMAEILLRTAKAWQETIDERDRAYRTLSRIESALGSEDDD